jgi:hypothetical protein
MLEGALKDADKERAIRAKEWDKFKKPGTPGRGDAFVKATRALERWTRLRDNISDIKDTISKLEKELEDLPPQETKGKLQKYITGD